MMMVVSKLSTTNEKYWIKRSELREKEAFELSVEAEKLLHSAYEEAQRLIIKDINDFYIRYMLEYGVSYREAKKLLTPRERKNWLADMKQRMKLIELGIDVRENFAMVDASAFGARISRLQARFAEIDVELFGLGNKIAQQMGKTLEEVTKHTYATTAYDAQTNVQMAYKIKQLNKQAIHEILHYPWSGADYSERIWNDLNKLRFNIRENLTMGIIRGDSIQTMSARMAKQLDKSKKDTTRLIRTEANYALNQTRLESYKMLNVERYQYLATLDNRTSAVCYELDGDIFDVAQAQVGINYPPMHPNCRSTTIPFIEVDNLQRAARDQNEKTIHISDKITYKEWKKKYLIEKTT